MASLYTTNLNDDFYEGLQTSSVSFTDRLEEVLADPVDSNTWIQPAYSSYDPDVLMSLAS